jgi:hypothetical protein
MLTVCFPYIIESIRRAAFKGESVLCGVWCSQFYSKETKASGFMVLSRLRSSLPTHLCGLSLKCQGAFAA